MELKGQEPFSSKRSSVCSSNDDDVFGVSTTLIQNYQPLAGSLAGPLKARSHNWGGRDASGSSDGEQDSTTENQSPNFPVHRADSLELGQEQRVITAPQHRPVPEYYAPAENPYRGNLPVSSTAPRQTTARRRIIFPTLHGVSGRCEDRETSQQSQEQGLFKSLQRGSSLPPVRSGLSPNMKPLDPPQLSLGPLLQTKRAIIRQPSDKELLQALDDPIERKTESSFSGKPLYIPPYKGEKDSRAQGILTLNIRPTAPVRSKPTASMTNAGYQGAGISSSGQPSLGKSLAAQVFAGGGSSTGWLPPNTDRNQESSIGAEVSDRFGSSQDMDKISSRSAPKVSPSILPTKTYYQPSSLPRYLQVDPNSPRRAKSKRKPLPSILRMSGSLPLPDSGSCAPKHREGGPDGAAAPSNALLPQAPPLAKLSSVISEECDQSDCRSLEEQIAVLSPTSPKLQPLPEPTEVEALDLGSVSKNDASSSSAASMRKAHSETCLVNHQEEGQKSNLTKEEKETLGSIRHPLTRHGSIEDALCKTIKFDPRVWVFEYERGQDEEDIWFTVSELEKFKYEAISLIQRRQTDLLPSGTGRIVERSARRPGASGIRALFSDPALGVDGDKFHGDCSPSPPLDSKKIQKAALKEIRNVLVIDPHEVFLKLFTKSIRSMMGHVIVTTARTPVEALRRIGAAQVVFPQSDGGATHGFDIIICEERLQPLHGRLASSQGYTSGNSAQAGSQAAGDDQNQRGPPSSGSALLGRIASEQREMEKRWRASPRWASTDPHPRFSLLVGVSSHLRHDREKLARSGARFVWGKPPPSMGANLRNELLKAVLERRGQPTIDIFG